MVVVRAFAAVAVLPVVELVAVVVGLVEFAVLVRRAATADDYVVPVTCAVAHTRGMERFQEEYDQWQ